MENNSKHHTWQQAQVSRLFDEALQHVLKEAKTKISDMDTLLDQWPAFEKGLLERMEQQRADVVGSVSGFDRHSRLRTLLLSKLSALLAADEPYWEFREPLRLRDQERQKKREIENELNQRKLFLQAQQLVAHIELMRLAVMRGDFLTSSDRAAISQARAGLPHDRQPISYWRDIGIIVRDSLASNPPHRFPQDIVLETPHAAALSRVFFRLNRYGSRVVDIGLPRFYTSIAKAVALLLERNPDADEPEVVSTALDCALALLKRWDDQGVFRHGAALRGKTRLFPCE